MSIHKGISKRIFARQPLRKGSKARAIRNVARHSSERQGGVAGRIQGEYTRALIIGILRRGIEEQRASCVYMRLMKSRCTSNARVLSQYHRTSVYELCTGGFESLSLFEEIRAAHTPRCG